MKSIFDSIRGSKEIIVTLFTLLAAILVVIIPELRPYKDSLIPVSVLLGLVLAGFVTVKDVTDKIIANKVIDVEALLSSIAEIIADAATPVEITKDDPKG
jgi:hypothetical protein